MEEAFSLLEGYLSKVTSSEYPTKMLQEVMDDIGVVNQKKTLKSALVDLGSKEWFKSLTSEIDCSLKMKKESAVLLSAKQVCDYVKSIYNGDKPFDNYEKEAHLDDDQGSQLEKEKGNQYFQEQSFNLAINAYTRVLYRKPYNHIVYGNRAQCCLNLREFRSALADGRRTITLEPTWEKGQYRYAQALGELEKYDDAIKALRNAIDVCTAKDDLEKYLKKIKEKRGYKASAAGLEKHFSRWVPDLVSPSNSDDSAGSVDNVNSDDDDDDDDLPFLIDSDDDDCPPLESDESDCDDTDAEGVEAQIPDLVSESSNDSDQGSVSSRIKNTARQKETEKKKKVKKNAVRDDAVKAAKASKVTEKKSSEEKAKKQEIKEKRKHKKHPRPCPEQKKLSVRDIMKQGTDALLDNRARSAIQCFEKALDKVTDSNEFTLPREETVVLLYAYGTAHYEAGTLIDLMEAEKQFKIIVETFHDITFPLAHYGSGKVLLKLNRYWEMQLPFHKAVELVKIHGIAEKYWPGSETVIDETKQGRLQIVIKELLALSVNPPKPDAICRYITCKQAKSYVYFSDPDFKGFVRLTCNQYCQIDYHMVCWKKIKSEVEGKSSEKDFLNSLCLTPECQGHFYLIRIYEESHGDVKTEFKVDLPKKSELPRKIHVDKSKRLKGSSYKKQLKSQRRRMEREQKRRANNIHENDKEIERILADPNAKIQYEPYFRDTTLDEDKGTTLPNSANINQGPTKKKVIPSNAIDDESDPLLTSTFHVLRKTDEEPLPKSYQKLKAKSKKKRQKNTQSLPEFLGPEKAKRLRSNLTEDSHECGREESEDRDIPFTSPTELEEECNDLERQWHHQFSRSVGNYDDEINESNARKHLYSLFEGLLKANGTADIENDSQIKDLLALLDIHSELLIGKCGGLKTFLSKSEKFAFSEDNANEVYLKEEQYIIDLSKREIDGKYKTDFNLEDGYFEPPQKSRNMTGTAHEIIQKCKPQIDENNVGLAKKQTNEASSTDSDNLGTIDIEKEEIIEKLLKLDTSIIGKKFNPNAKEFVPCSRNTSFCSDDGNSDPSGIEPITANLLSEHKELIKSVWSNPTEEELRQEIEDNLEMEDELVNVNGGSNPPLGSDVQNSFLSTGKGFNLTATTFHTSVAPTFIPLFIRPPTSLFPEPNSFPSLSSKTFMPLSLQHVQPPRFTSETSQGKGTNTRKHDIFIPPTTNKNGINELRSDVKTETINPGNSTITTNDKDTAKNMDPNCNKEQSYSKVQVDTDIHSNDTVLKCYSVDIGIMTDFVKNEYLELFEKECHERKKLLKKYEASMDAVQQKKQKLLTVKEKYEKENCELKEKLEELKRQLMKEQHTKENEQKKWQVERKELTDQVKSLKEKIKNSKEESYKEQIARQNTEIMNLQEKFDHERKERANDADESEDIIKKLSNCLTEHSKRAQKSEIAYIELKRDEMFIIYRKAITDTQMALRFLENHPLLLSNNKNIQELLKLWQGFGGNINDNLENSKREFEKVLDHLKEGKPLESIPPITPSQIPPPPPFPPQLLPPGAFPPGQLQPPFPFLPGPRGVFTQFGAPLPRTRESEPTLSCQKEAEPTLPRPREAEPRPSAQPTESDIKDSSIPRPKPLTAQEAASSLILDSDALSSASTAAAQQNKGRGSSFEKIMLRLGAEFPNYSREQLTDFIKEFRERRNNTLSGLRLEGIIENVSQLIRDKQLAKEDSSANDQRSLSTGDSNPVTINSQSNPNELNKQSNYPASVRSKATSAPWTGKLEDDNLLKHFGDKEPCIICHDDMLPANPTLNLQCGHIFHSECIRRWLEEQRTCPTCRDHALLPDEFPTLN